MVMVRVMRARDPFAFAEATSTWVMGEAQLAAALLLPGLLLAYGLWPVTYIHGAPG